MVPASSPCVGKMSCTFSGHFWRYLCLDALPSQRPYRSIISGVGARKRRFVSARASSASFRFPSSSSSFIEEEELEESFVLKGGMIDYYEVRCGIIFPLPLACS